MASIKMPPQLDCNRLVKEENENREYKKHLKKLASIRKSTKPNDSSDETLRLPDINKKNLIKIQHEIEFYEKEMNGTNVNNSHRLQNGSNSSNYSYTYNIQNISNNNSKKYILNNYWNPAYEQLKNRNPLRTKHLQQIENENEKMKKRINQVKGSISLKKMDKDFEQHQAMLKLTSKAYYTPRGIGHRKANNLNALPDIKPFNRKKKNAVSMLNEAVNQQERGDIVLIKTMLNLNYYERMETKRKYEETYNSELKKGLIKVMDKEYEPLLTAILTDKDLHDADRIYESLYDPNEAAVIITESLISRNSYERDTLLETFKKKIEYDLKDEITSKIPQSDLRNILLDLLANENLDSNLEVDLDKIKSDVEELKTLDEIPLDSEILLNAIKTNSKEQLKALFEQHQKEEGIDICSKMETNKPVGKVFKAIQSCLTNPALYYAEKLQKNIKTNETEFIRLLSVYSKDELKDVEREYKQKYKTYLNDDISTNLTQDISRLVLQILNPVIVS